MRVIFRKMKAGDHVRMVMIIAASMVLCAGIGRAQNTWTVTDAASWQTAIAGAATDSAGGLTDTINIENSFTGSVQQVVNADVIINGNGNTINMQGLDRALFIAGGAVNISNLTISNGNAIGGYDDAGGGGGAGLGGAIFVGSGSYATGSGASAILGLSVPNVTLSNVSFTGNQAVGGSSAIIPESSVQQGGGGGMGGAAGSLINGGGGGGFGNSASGAGITDSGSNGAFLNVSSGVATAGGAGGEGGSSGGEYGGGGGSGGTNGGGGGVGGGQGGGQSEPGGTGGFGGGGGGSINNGGMGGFGGGGGAGSAGEGSDGGAGGFGAARGTNPTGTGGGGGGLGAGGAIFVMQGANVTIVQNGTASFSNNSVTAGTGYFNGSAYGADLFLGGNVAFSVAVGDSLSVDSLGGAGNTSDPNVTKSPADQTAQASGGIVKTGAGSLVLTGTSYYSGTTIINSGTLALADGAFEQGTESVIVGQNDGDNATLAFGSSSVLNVQQSIIIAQQAGSTGTVVIGNGVGSNGADLGVSEFIGGSGTATVFFDENFAAGSQDAVYYFNTTLAGSLGIVQSGPGTTVLNPLSGANSFTGGITVSGGILQISSGSALPADGNITVNEGYFDICGANATSGTLSMEGGSVIDSSGGGLLSLAAVIARSGTISANIGGAASVTQEGAGATTLSGSNSYHGGTRVNSGTLIAGNANALGSGNVQVNAGTLLVQGGQAIGNAVTLSGGKYDVGIGAGGSFQNLANASSSFSGGTNTAASLLGGTSSGTTTLETAFSTGSGASNDGIRESDVYSLDGIEDDDLFVLELSATSVAPVYPAG